MELYCMWLHIMRFCHSETSNRVSFMTVLTLVFKLPIKVISNIFIPDTFLRQYLDTVKVILIGFKSFKIVVPNPNNKDKTTET